MITRDPILVRHELPSLLPMTGRSPGRHVSNIISELCVEYGHYDAQVDRGAGVKLSFLERLEPRARMIIELGCTFESALISRRNLDDPGMFVEPGQQEMDGVFGTPDLLAVHYGRSLELHPPMSWPDESSEHVVEYLLTVPTAVMEVKLTYMSSDRGPRDEKLWRYWVQICAYCKMMGVDWGVLCVLYMEGDYRQSGPLYREWAYQFSSQELDGNWAMLMLRA